MDVHLAGAFCRCRTSFKFHFHVDKNLRFLASCIRFGLLATSFLTPCHQWDRLMSNSPAFDPGCATIYTVEQSLSMPL